MNEPLILNGKKVADELYSKLPNMNGKELAIITIGDDEASKVYVRNKIKACEKVGLKGVNYRFKSNTSYVDILKRIRKLNLDSNVVGIMIQQPYPNKFKRKFLEKYITPSKDVDGLSLENLCLTLKGEKPNHYPATPKGIITLLDYYNIFIEGKNVVIIGRSDIVGKPLAAMMTARDATVTVCHSKTTNLKEHTLNADIIISAIGSSKFIDKSFIYKTEWDYYKDELKIINKKPVIIDVGINRDENGKFCGDVDFDDVLPYVSAITPVPRGVGPMTVYSLIENCCKNV